MLWKIAPCQTLHSRLNIKYSSAACCRVDLVINLGKNHDENIPLLPTDAQREREYV